MSVVVEKEDALPLFQKHGHVTRSSLSQDQSMAGVPIYILLRLRSCSCLFWTCHRNFTRCTRPSWSREQSHRSPDIQQTRTELTHAGWIGWSVTIFRPFAVSLGCPAAEVESMCNDAEVEDSNWLPCEVRVHLVHNITPVTRPLLPNAVHASRASSTVSLTVILEHGKRSPQ